jgi:hypothetical protein
MLRAAREAFLVGALMRFRDCIMVAVVLAVIGGMIVLVVSKRGHGRGGHEREGRHQQ